MSRQALDRVLNAVLGLATFLVVFLAYKTFVKSHLVPRTVIAAFNQENPKVGDFISIAGRPLVDSKGGLVLVIRQGCIYCSESMPFYRDLIKTHAPGTPPL